MKYTEDFSKKVLEKTDTVRLIGRYTKLRSENGVYIGDCPFDKSGKDTFVVYPNKQTFHCFDCGASGNAATFLMIKDNISMTQAIETLARITRTEITKADIDNSSNQILKDNLINIYRDAAIFYMNKLQSEEGKRAIDYLKNRELTDETIKSFALGYSPTKGNALYKYLKAKGYDNDIMLKAGLIKISETGPYDMFRGRVMFPIINEDKHVVAFSGRVMDPDIKPKYLNSPESLIFNKSNILFGIHAVPKHNNYLLLCEGQMDVISLHQAGFKNAVATLGTAFTQTHIPVVKRHSDGNIILTFDSDAAGQKAAMRTIKTVDGQGIGIRVLSMEPYKDPDEFIKGLGADEYKERMKRSMDKTNFELKYLSQQYDLNDAKQKEDFLNKAVSTIINDKERELDSMTIEPDLN